MSSSMESFLDTRPEPLPPPPGIEADLNAPNTNGTAYIIVAVIGIFFATVFVVVRLYTKAILTRSLGWDDCNYFLFFFFFLTKGKGVGELGIDVLLGWAGIPYRR